MTTSAINVANWFIKSGYDMPRNTKDGNMKLQKMLYFSQLVHLAKFNEPLFNEDIIAFENGSVVEEVRQPYHYQHEMFISNAINSVVKLTKEQSYTLTIVEEVFGDLNAGLLSDLNHQNESWREAYEASRVSPHFYDKFLGTISISSLMQNEIPIIRDIINAFELRDDNLLSIKVNGRNFYFDPSEIKLDKEIYMMLDSFDGEDSAYTLYKDDEMGIIVY